MSRKNVVFKRIALWTIGLLVALVLFTYVAIRLPAVQNYVRKRAVTFLQEKIGTRVEVAHLRITFPKNILLEGVYFEDQQGDTLFAGEKLLADISLFKLLRNTLKVNELELHGITANIHRTADSTFNFQYILDSLVSETPEPVSKDSKPFVISLNDILFERIALKYLDEPSATDISAWLGYFEANVKEFDLQNERFEVPKIVLKNSTATFTQGEPFAVSESMQEDIADSDEPIPFDLQFGTIDFENVDLTYTNAISDIASTIEFGNLSVHSDKLELENKKISLNEVNLSKSNISIVLGDRDNTEVVKEEVRKEVEVQSDVWQIEIKAINLEENAFVYDDNAISPSDTGIDFSHLGIQGLNLDAVNITYAGNEFGGKVISGSLLEKRGFELKQLRGELFLGRTQGHASDLFLETKNSIVDADIQLIYADIDSISIAPEDIYQKTIIRESKIAMTDILLLAPDLYDVDFFKENSTEVVRLQADMDGKLGDLQIRHVKFSGLGHTELSTSGTVRGLPDVEKAVFDLNIDQFHTHSSDILALIPKGTLPATISLPKDIQVRGRFQGNIREFVADLDFNTSFGKAMINGTVGLDEPMYFRGKLSLDQFDIGKVMKGDTTFGRVTLHSTVDLQSIDTDNISGNFSGTVQSFEYLKYNYKNIEFEGDAQSGVINALVNMEDPNLKFQLDGTVQVTEYSSPAVDFKLNLEHAELQALHFYDSELRLSGRAIGDFTSIDPDSLNGILTLSDFVIADSSRRVVLDTVFLASTATPDSNTLTLNADFIHLKVAGKYHLSSVFPAIQQTISAYFGGSTNVTFEPSAPQKFDINAQITYSPLFTQLDSSIVSFAPIELKGNYNSEGHIINLQVQSDRIQYEPVSIYSANLDVTTRGNALNYSLGWDKAKSGDISFRKTELQGELKDNAITSELIVLDSLDRRRFHVNAMMEQVESRFVISMSQEDLLLNYDKWTIATDNKVEFAEGALAVRNFVLSNGMQSLSVNSEPFGFNNPIKVDFNDFQIETLTEIISGDSLLAGGIIDGTALVRNYFESPVFTADLGITDLSYQGDTIGNVSLLVNNETSNTLSAKIGIEGSGNKVDVEGQYFIASESIDLAMHISTLRLASVQGFSEGGITDASGSVRGDLMITGALMKPVVEGDLHFDSASVRIAELNSVYTLANEGVRFTTSDVHFNNFTITDEEDNNLNINGIIYTRTFTNFQFELDIVSKNFKVLNTEARGNDLYYGTLYLDSRIRIRGGLNNPEVNADLTILDNTQMTVIIPQTSPGIVEREGVVRFVDLDHPDLDSILTVDLDTFNTSSIQGLVAFANIKVTDESEFKLVIDQGNGDFLRLKGNAELNASLDPSGKISLTGNYVLEEGIYELSFNFLKRRFDIRKGSTITWNGEPTSGVVDITGVYIVEAAPIDLVDRQLSGATPAELNLYKEKLPFELLLKLSGTLMKPEVSFDIRLPEGNYAVSPDVITTVQARLAQLSREESEVNKQAFALVLLNRFISEDPFTSMSGGTTAESYARQSVSKLLSQQLNNFSASLLSGVDLTFDLESQEDYSTGQLQNRTDLNVSASKRLLDDRITVSVGSNFELEGAQQANEKTSNIAGDISIEYQLSKDGRYLLRAYRKNEYEVAVEGHVVKTGLSFVIQMDYDKFKEIWKSNKEKNRKD